MPLTIGELAKELERFQGGQLEIQNEIEEYLFRGEVKSAEIIDGELRVHFTWSAKGVGYPPLPDKWIRENNLEYGLSLLPGLTFIKNMGPEMEGSDRISIESVISNETLVFFPPDGSKLDPAKIEEPDAVPVI